MESHGTKRQREAGDEQNGNNGNMNKYPKTESSSTSECSDSSMDSFTIELLNSLNRPEDRGPSTSQRQPGECTPEFTSADDSDFEEEKCLKTSSRNLDDFVPIPIAPYESDGEELMCVDMTEAFPSSCASPGNNNNLQLNENDNTNNIEKKPATGILKEHNYTTTPKNVSNHNNSAPGTSNQSNNNYFAPGTSNQSNNNYFAPGTSNQSNNNYSAPGTSNQNNYSAAPRASVAGTNQVNDPPTTIMSGKNGERYLITRRGNYNIVRKMMNHDSR